MNVAAVIVEQLEADGHIKRLTMKGSTPEFDVAFPDEFVGERCGPFFFPERENEELFKKSFADCKVLKLAKDSFKAVNGDYSLRIERGGIPTERGQLSYYCLSLPEFAIPSEVTLKDPYSNRPLYKSVYRDKCRNRFAIYVECRSRHGIFDFLLEVRFTIGKDKFPGFLYEDEYKDDFLSKYGRQITAYERLLPSDQRGVARKFFSGSTGREPSQTTAGLSAPATEPAGDEGTLFTAPANGDYLTDREKRGQHCYEIIEEAKRISYLSGRGHKMFEIRQEHPDFRIWKVVSNLQKEDQDYFEHPNQWGAPVVTYTLGLLGKAYGKSWTTVRDWVKEYKRQGRAK